MEILTSSYTKTSGTLVKCVDRKAWLEVLVLKCNNRLPWLFYHDQTQELSRESCVRLQMIFISLTSLFIFAGSLKDWINGNIKQYFLSIIL